MTQLNDKMSFMNKKLVPVVLFSLFALASCTKTARVVPDPVTPDPTAGYTYSMSSIYNSLKNLPKTVTINPAIGGSFYGNSGTKYTFPANAFQTPSGGSVVGNIQLDVIEYVKRGDMIFSRVLPVSNGDALVSGGELSVTASQAGAKLVMKPGVTFTAQVPQLGVISTGMQAYYGQTVNTTTSPIDWYLGGVSALGAATCFGDTVTITSDSVGLVSAGHLLSSPSYQSFTVTVNGVTFDDSDHVQAYALYDNYRVAYPMMSRYHQKFSETHVASLPLHFVVYTVYHGDFYGGISTNTQTPLTGGNYTVNLTKVNPITFLDQVNVL